MSSKPTSGRRRTPDRYHYRECGLPNVWLLNGFKVKDTPYGRGVSIHDMAALHSCIGKALCDKSKSLTGFEFRFLRVEMDYSEDELGGLLGLTGQQIRNIENERTAIQEWCDRLVRHVYLESIDPMSVYAEEVSRRHELGITWDDLCLLTRGREKDWTKAPATLPTPA